MRPPPQLVGPTRGPLLLPFPALTAVPSSSSGKIPGPDRLPERSEALEPDGARSQPLGTAKL